MGGVLTRPTVWPFNQTLDSSFPPDFEAKTVVVIGSHEQGKSFCVGKLLSLVGLYDIGLQTRTEGTKDAQMYTASPDAEPVAKNGLSGRYAFLDTEGLHMLVRASEVGRVNKLRLKSFVQSLALGFHTRVVYVCSTFGTPQELFLRYLTSIMPVDRLDDILVVHNSKTELMAQLPGTRAGLGTNLSMPIVYDPASRAMTSYLNGRTIAHFMFAAHRGDDEQAHNRAEALRLLLMVNKQIPLTASMKRAKDVYEDLVLRETQELYAGTTRMVLRELNGDTGEFSRLGPFKPKEKIPKQVWTTIFDKLSNFGEAQNAWYHNYRVLEIYGVHPARLESIELSSVTPEELNMPDGTELDRLIKIRLPGVAQVQAVAVAVQRAHEAVLRVHEEAERVRQAERRAQRLPLADDGVPPSILPADTWVVQMPVLLEVSREREIGRVMRGDHCAIYLKLGHDQTASADPTDKNYARAAREAAAAHAERSS